MTTPPEIRQAAIHALEDARDIAQVCLTYSLIANCPTEARLNHMRGYSEACRAIMCEIDKALGVLAVGRNITNTEPKAESI